MSAIDAIEIVPHIYVGSYPEERAATYRDAGFSAIALCAVELQPPDEQFAGLEVIRAPMNDSSYLPLTQSEAQVAEAAAARVVALATAGKKVLVTCQMGVNRSAFVAALALQHLGFARDAAVATVRAQRGSALAGTPWHKRVLCNASFVLYLLHRKAAA